MSPPHPAELPAVAASPLLPVTASGERRERGQAWRPGVRFAVRVASPVGGRPRPGWGGQGITGSSFPLRCANQNKTKPTKNTVVLSLRQIKTHPPKHSPHLFPPSEPLRRRGPRQGSPWLWLSAWPWPWPGLEATRGCGTSSRRPSTAPGKVRVVLRARLPGAGGTGGQKWEQGFAPEAVPGNRRGQVPSLPLGD